MVNQTENHRIAQSKDVRKRREILNQLINNFTNLPDKDHAWKDLITYTKDEDNYIKKHALTYLYSAFSQVPNKEQATKDLQELTKDKDGDVRNRAAEVLGKGFCQIIGEDQEKPHEINEWRIGNQDQMAKNVENLIFNLRSKIPFNPENKDIYDKIEEIRNEKDLTKQYELLTVLISLIPTHVNINNSNVIISDNESVISKADDGSNKNFFLDQLSSTATIAAFIGFLAIEIGTYFYPIYYSHYTSVLVSITIFIMVFVLKKKDSRYIAGTIGGGLLGASLLGPIGAVLGAVFGAFLIKEINKEERERRNFNG